MTCKASLVRQVWRTYRNRRSNKYKVEKFKTIKNNIHCSLPWPKQPSSPIPRHSDCSFPPGAATSAAGVDTWDGSQCLGFHSAQPCALSLTHLYQRLCMQTEWPRWGCRFPSASLGLLLLAEAFLTVSSGKAQLSGPLHHWYLWLFLHWLKASTYALDLAEPPIYSPSFLWVNLTFWSTQPKPDFQSRSAFGYCSALSLSLSREVKHRFWGPVQGHTKSF